LPDVRECRDYRVFIVGVTRESRRIQAGNRERIEDGSQETQKQKRPPEATFHYCKCNNAIKLTSLYQRARGWL